MKSALTGSTRIIQNFAQEGVEIRSLEEITSDQKDWHAEDLCKHIDFSEYAFWITTDDGASPIGIDDDEDLAKHVDVENY